MPRSALKTDPRVEHVRGLLREYLRTERGRQIRLERATGVKQYTISRFISGRTRKLSADIRLVCKYAEISTENGIEFHSDNARLQAALSKVWDGKPETAEVIAMLIEAMGPLVQMIVRYRAKSESGE
ncbi:MAG TPA: hypothetical protein VG897_11940 [Terriglobales bacterium]|nr:hypothetical protein [Terriglobales bacterium]